MHIILILFSLCIFLTFIICENITERINGSVLLACCQFALQRRLDRDQPGIKVVETIYKTHENDKYINIKI